MAKQGFDFSRFQYQTVIFLPPKYEVFDFTKGYDPGRALASAYGVGRYDEKRRGMYETELFDPSGPARRDVHIGLDIAAPAGTPVRAFFEGRIHLSGINPASGDYGGTIITEHQLGDRTLWALHGHLSHASVRASGAKKPGERFQGGDVIGWLGEPHENGGWNPHLHFQLSWLKPQICDMPGVVSEADREQALLDYPDPRQVLGPLY